MAARMCSGLFAGIKNSNPVSSRKRTAEKEGHNTFLWNGIHKMQEQRHVALKIIHFFGMKYTNTGLARLRRKSIHFLGIEYTIQIHVALKNTKYVFESDVKHEQDCIHFFGLDYTSTKTEESQ